MGGYTSKCEKKSKSLHPNVDQRAGMRWGIFAFLKFKNVCLCAEKPEDAPSL
jgi:hypothetical protein